MTLTSVELDAGCDGSSIVCALAFPLGRELRMVALPLRQGPVLVVDAEVAGWEPPFDCSADRGPPAPAVRIASAFAAVRVVEPMKKRVRHNPDLSSYQVPLI